MLIRACVLIITKVPPKKSVLKQKKQFFCLHIKKNCYLWFIINNKTYKKMEISTLQLISGFIGSGLIVAFSIIYVNLKK